LSVVVLFSKSFFFFKKKLNNNIIVRATIYFNLNNKIIFIIIIPIYDYAMYYNRFVLDYVTLKSTFFRIINVDRFKNEFYCSDF
jgi:hypothetical protein